MKPHRSPKREKPFVPRWTAHMQEQQRYAAGEALRKKTRQEPFDDGFRDVLPPGAIRADVRRQSLGWGDDPIFFYKDREFTCRWCGKPEVWTARQQQWWYEVARGHVQRTAIACRACRKQRKAVSAESVALAWKARIGRLRKLSSEIGEVLRSGPWMESIPLSITVLADLRLPLAAVEKLAESGMVTVSDLLSRVPETPIPGVSLHDLDLLIRKLKGEIGAACQ